MSFIIQRFIYNLERLDRTKVTAHREIHQLFIKNESSWQLRPERIRLNQPDIKQQQANNSKNIPNIFTEKLNVCLLQTEHQPITSTTRLQKGPTYQTEPDHFAVLLSSNGKKTLICLRLYYNNVWFIITNPAFYNNNNMNSPVGCWWW